MTSRRFSPLTTNPNRCQTVAWKDHKKSCGGQAQAQQLTLDNIRTRVLLTQVTHNFAEALRWESRFEELIVGQDNETIMKIVMAFLGACRATGKLEKLGPLMGIFSDVCEASGRFDLHVQVNPKP